MSIHAASSWQDKRWDHLDGPSQTLQVVVETPPSPPLSDTSFAKSTYSWATQFSGETAELRTTAQYISSTPLDSEEEFLDSPGRLDKRRKRIMAIAHTVRQLEGIGSREMEDPAVLEVIAKAWYDRPGNTPVDTKQLLPPRNLSVTLTLDGSVREVLSPSTTSASASSERYHNWDAEVNVASPPDIEFRTPLVPSAIPFDRRSNRYSYASTLHDLALDGGLQQGNKLMSEKAWLRSDSNTPWGRRFSRQLHSFNPGSSSTPRASFVQEPSTPRASTVHLPPSPVLAHPLESPIIMSEPPERPPRPLRRNDTSIPQPTTTANIARQPAVMHQPIAEVGTISLGLRFRQLMVGCRTGFSRRGGRDSTYDGLEQLCRRRQSRIVASKSKRISRVQPLPTELDLDHLPKSALAKPKSGDRNGGGGRGGWWSDIADLVVPLTPPSPEGITGPTKIDWDDPANSISRFHSPSVSHQYRSRGPINI